MAITTIPYWRLRRFAPRVLAILARHADLEPVIQEYAQTIGLSAASFLSLYDQSLARKDTQGVRHASGKAKVDELRRKLRGWVAMVGAEVEFDATKYGDNPNVPDDVINDVDQFLTFVTEYEESAGEPLAFSGTLRQDLEQALAETKALMADVSTGAAGRSSLTEELREAAQTFNRHLVAFRRTLAAHLGTSHADYQKLRTVRAQTPDADDDQVADDMPPEDEVSPEEALEDAIAESGEIDGAEEAAE
jgi:hypothetical protein